jgi:hypothetical protein
LHYHLGKLAQSRGQAFPDPSGEKFTSRVVEALDLIEVVVIKALEHRRHGLAYVGEVAHPTGPLVNLAFQVDGDPEGVAMQTRTFVARRDVRESVGRLEGELL